jgi:phospholipid-binding lipoprotein MlaA
MIAAQIAFLSLAFAPLDARVEAPSVVIAAPVTVSALADASAPVAAPPGASSSAPTAAPSPDAQPAPATEAPPVAAPVTAAPASPAPASPAPAADSTAPSPSHDPLEGFNRASYAVSQPIDRFVLRPVAMIYQFAVPRPLQDGVRNLLANLFEPVVFVNDVLQLRPKRALRTTKRFLLNSTLGIAGLFDVAKRPPFHTPAHANGFADTLGYYGFHAGPYLYLPVIGPATLRDAAGYAADWFTQPRLLAKMVNPDSDKSLLHSQLKLGTWGTVAIVVGGVDQRARNDGALKAITSQSVDPYAALRSSFLQAREGEIAALKAKDGAPATIPAFNDPLEDPARPKLEAGTPLPR